MDSNLYGAFPVKRLRRPPALGLKAEGEKSGSQETRCWRAGGEWIRTLRPARDQPKWEPSRCRSTSDFQRHDEGLSASSSGGDQHSKLDKVTRLTSRSRHGREEF